MNLTCPKCISEMRNYERNRILVDQCTGCGGLFLDRGELEKLVAAENSWHDEPALAPAAAQQSGYQDRPRPDDRRDDSYDRPRYDTQRHDERPRYDDRRDGSYDRPRKKKKSFLSELFDD
jgi:hypothetical protein